MWDVIEPRPAVLGLRVAVGFAIAAAMLTGCADHDCDALQPLITPSMADTPGTLQAAFLESDRAHGGVTVRADGVVLCLLCSRVALLDRGLEETGRFAIDDLDAEGVRAVAVPDAIYVLRNELPRKTTLVALSPDGAPRWTASIATDLVPISFVAGPEGPYVGVTATPGGARRILGFDAGTGETRTLTFAADARLLGAANGGVIVAEPTDASATTLHQLDAAGAVRWSRAIVATPGDHGSEGAVGTPDGGAIVFGPGRTVAGFDAAGAPQWSFEVRDYDVTHLALSATGQIVLGGHVGGSYPTPADSFVSVASPAGITRTFAINGAEDQVLGALAPDPGGAVWVQVASHPGDDNRPTPTVQIAGSTFEGAGNYLLKIVP